jgi:quercetin dioxygenase-like cupin family protein
VLDGELEIELSGHDAERLQAGDTLYYPATIPHRWRAVGDRTARFLIVTSPSTF